MKEDNREALRPYIADMLAVDKHILEAIERQQKDNDIREFPNALHLIDRIEAVLRRHVQTLETHLEGFPGGGAAGAVKSAVTGIMGAVAGVYDKVRKDITSRALRDDYTALSLSTISYTMLHATALGLRQGATAEIALRHLKNLTPLVMELNEVIPTVVAKELSSEGYDIETGVAQQAVRNTQEAWRLTSSHGDRAADQVAAGTPTGVGTAGSYTR